MKRNVVAVMIMSFLCAPAVRAEMNVGFGGGVAFSTLDVQGGGTDAAAGMVLGGTFQYGFTDMFFLDTGLRYIQRKSTIDLVGATAKFSSDHLEVPMHFLAKFLPGETFRPLVFFGPNIAFKTSSNLDVRSDSGTDLSAQGVQGSALETIDVSLEAGGGGEFAVAPGWSLFATGSYSYGLTNVNTARGTGSVKNRSILALVGVNYAL